MYGLKRLFIMFFVVLGLVVSGCETAGVEEKVLEAKELEGKVLNNLVTEYLNTSVVAPETSHKPKRSVATYTFEAPREKWFFISLQTKEARVRVCLDSLNPKDAVIVSNSSEKEPIEAMRLVEKGVHTIRVFMGKRGGKAKLIVRSIPGIMFFPISFAAWEQETSSDCLVKNDWAFIQKYIFKNCNSLAFFNVEDFQPYINEWRAYGKKALIKRNVRPVIGASEEECYAYWSLPLEKHPNLDGTTIDEFGKSPQHQSSYSTWANAFDRITAEPDCAGKKLYSFWGSAEPIEEQRVLIEATHRNNFRWLGEHYLLLSEGNGDEAGQLKYITAHTGNKFERYRKMFPNLIEDNLFHTFATFHRAISADLSPELDYKVFLDLQFNHIATYPSVADLYGVCFWTVNQLTEETLRYLSDLARHYCIEGNTDRYNTDPIKLSYIQNAGFEEGMNNWDITEAGPGTVTVMETSDLSYSKPTPLRMVPHQKKMLRTQRQADAANVISQTISNLATGRYYSVQVMVSDHTDYGVTKFIPISIEIDGVDINDEETSDNTWTMKYTADENKKVDVCWNYHFRVFRAKSSHAVLKMSDWAKPNTSGGEVGHEILWDFIQVQPFYAEVN